VGEQAELAIYEATLIVEISSLIPEQGQCLSFTVSVLEMKVHIPLVSAPGADAED
jgi:hypothetical protein